MKTINNKPAIHLFSLKGNHRSNKHWIAEIFLVKNELYLSWDTGKICKADEKYIKRLIETFRMIKV